MQHGSTIKSNLAKTKYKAKHKPYHPYKTKYHPKSGMVAITKFTPELKHLDASASVSPMLWTGHRYILNMVHTANGREGNKQQNVGCIVKGTFTCKGIGVTASIPDPEVRVRICVLHFPRSPNDGATITTAAQPWFDITSTGDYTNAVKEPNFWQRWGPKLVYDENFSLSNSTIGAANQQTISTYIKMPNVTAYEDGTDYQMDNCYMIYAFASYGQTTTSVDMALGYRMQYYDY